MPDQRVIHSHVAHSVYGEHGPRNELGYFSPRPLVNKLKWHGEPPPPPASISEHIAQTVQRIPNLSPKQRASVIAAVTEMTRDLSFVRHIMDQMPRAPVQDEGRIL